MYNLFQFTKFFFCIGLLSWFASGAGAQNQLNLLGGLTEESDSRLTQEAFDQDPPVSKEGSSQVRNTESDDVKADIVKAIQPVTVTEQDIEAPSHESKGNIIISSGPFSHKIWKGVSREHLEELFMELPSRVELLYLQDLLSFILQLSAEVPPQNAKMDLLLFRAQFLRALGYISEAKELLSNVELQEGAVFLQKMLEWESLLLEGDFSLATQFVEEQVRRTPNSYWKKALIYCQLLNGEQEKARLGYELFKEESKDRADVLEFVLNQSKVLDSSSIELHDMVLLSSLDKGSEWVKRAPFPLKLNLAIKGSFVLPLTLSKRIEVIEQATEAGILHHDYLMDLYKKIVEEADQKELTRTPQHKKATAFYKIMEEEGDEDRLVQEIINYTKLSLLTGLGNLPKLLLADVFQEISEEGKRKILEKSPEVYFYFTKKMPLHTSEVITKMALSETPYLVPIFLKNQAKRLPNDFTEKLLMVWLQVAEKAYSVTEIMNIITILDACGVKISSSFWHDLGLKYEEVLTRDGKDLFPLLMSSVEALRCNRIGEATFRLITAMGDKDLHKMSPSNLRTTLRIIKELGLDDLQEMIFYKLVLQKAE